jgi:hypothetical protein
MADLAFDPSAPPEYGPEVAQALPEPSPFQQLPAGAPPPAPTAPPPPPSGQGDQPGAVQTEAPPVQPPPPAAAPAPLALPSDNDDMQQQQAADLEEQQQYGTLRSHHGNYEILKDSVTSQSHPNFSKYERGLEIYATMDKQSRARWKPLLDNMKATIQNDTKTQNAKIKDQLRVEAAQADAKYEDVNQRTRTGDTISGFVDDTASNITDAAKDRDPKVAQENSFTLQTSPLSTMSAKRRDGTMNYEPIRNAATSIATLNGGMAPDLAVKTVLSLASPIGFDDTGKPLPGKNGKTGAGATSYQVIGRDIRDNYLVVTHDGTHVRVSPETMDQLRQARQAGYRVAKKLQLEHSKATTEPDMLTRAWRSIIPGKGF